MSVSHSPESEHRIYVRNGGNDALGGLTELTAVATIPRAEELLLKDCGPLVKQVIDLTGFNGTGARYLWLSGVKGSRREYVPFDDLTVFEDAKGDYLFTPMEYRADPLHVLDVTTSSVADDPTTGLPVITVDETLTVDAHQGQFIWMPTLLDFGVIHSNTANTITVATRAAVTFAGTLSIYTHSCTLNYGTVGQGSRAGVFFSPGSRTIVSGIKFLNTAMGGGGWASVGSTCREWVTWSRCSFQGADMEDGVWTNFQDCYFDGSSLYMETAVDYLGCVFQGVDLDSHGSGGQGRNGCADSIFDGCSAIGDGNWESTQEIEIDRCWIMNGTAEGVLRKSSTAGSVQNCLIENCAGDAISVPQAGGVFKVQNNTGTGNGGYGLNLANGAQALDQGGNTVTGTSGEVKVGDSSASTWVTAKPRTDVGETNPQFCRIY